MLITKRTSKKKYVIEGAGIFDSIWNFFARMFSSNAAKQLASDSSSGRKTAAKDIGMKAIDMGKTVAIDAGKKLVENALKKINHKKTANDAIFRGAAAGAGKVSLDKMSWFMPHVISADAEKYSIYKTIESKVKLPVAYRTRQCDMLSVPESISFTWRLSVKTEKPRFTIVRFQTAKDGNQTKNPSM